MRTRVSVDRELLRDAIRLTGARSARESVELALRQMIALKRQDAVRKWRGKLPWAGDLDAMRASQSHQIPVPLPESADRRLRRP